MPALEFLKADYTEVWISAALVPLVQFADRVRAISLTQLDLVGLGDLPFPLGLSHRLSDFDEVVSWYGTNRPEFRTALSQVHPRCTFFPALPPNDWPDAAMNYFLQQVGGPSGLIPRVHVPVGKPRRSLVIHPFSGSAAKNWPIDRYRELAALSRRPVEWIAGPEETLEAAMRFENLLELASWMRGAEAYIGNDSGISHLAAAIGLPSVILFGPTNPLIWAPRGHQIQILQATPITELTVSQVSRTLPPCPGAVPGPGV